MKIKCFTAMGKTVSFLQEKSVFILYGDGAFPFANAIRTLLFDTDAPRCTRSCSLLFEWMGREYTVVPRCDGELLLQRENGKSIVMSSVWCHHDRSNVFGFSQGKAKTDRPKSMERFLALLQRDTDRGDCRPIFLYCPSYPELYPYLPLLSEIGRQVLIVLEDSAPPVPTPRSVQVIRLQAENEKAQNF